MIKEKLSLLLEADAKASNWGLGVALRTLRVLTLDEFCELMLHMPMQIFPGLSKLLPRMADAKIQLDWTGSDGYNLLYQTISFAKSISEKYNELNNGNLPNARILDYGCGYGRILRAMLYFSDPDSVFGCDPWDRSLEICRADGVQANLAKSAYFPSTLPFLGSFDLIYAYSVFTHTSERATKTAIETLLSSLSPTGILAFTIRPDGWWQFDRHTDQSQKDELNRLHKEKGFAFSPHQITPIDGEIAYGDTSMTLSYLEENFPNARIVGNEPASDPKQIIVYLSKNERQQ